jgi:hypothetical protein
MTESTHEERVQESGVVGHSYDTDDRIGELDIYEALVNPHDEHSGGKKGGAGGPTMMPMGAGAGSGSGSSGTSGTAAGVPGSSAAKGTSAASGGGTASGFAGTGSAGAGGISGAGFGASGLGGGGLPAGSAGAGLGGLSGLGGGLGSGGLSGSGSSWGAPSYGTGAAGLTDPTINQPPADGGTGPNGGITVPTIPTTATPTIPTVPGANPTTTPSPIKMPSTPSPSANGIKAPSAAGGAGMPSGGGGGASANTSDLGAKAVKASPEMLHKEAQHWDDTSKEFAANVTNPVGNQSPSSVDFGMMKDAFGSYNDLLARLKKWSTEAGTEFSAISQALQSASGGYADTEATNTAAASTSNIPE